MLKPPPLVGVGPPELGKGKGAEWGWWRQGEPGEAEQMCYFTFDARLKEREPHTMELKVRACAICIAVQEISKTLDRSAARCRSWCHAKPYHSACVSQSASQSAGK